MIRVRGFSLLELLIVLAVIAGLAAVVFPSLTRPLAENEVGRAAASLRDAIVDCRNAASLRQELLLLRLEANSPTITWGDWQALMVDSFETPNASASQFEGTTTTSSTNPRPLVGEPQRSKLMRLSFPETIVVEQVVWWQASHKNSDLNSEIVASGSEGRAVYEPMTEDRSTWYLPCLPTGRCKDCQIILRDNLTGARCGLSVDGVLRMMRIERLQTTSDSQTGGAINDPIGSDTRLDSSDEVLQ